MTASEDTVLIQARDLSLGDKQAIIDGVSIAVFPGEIVTVVGPNGAGKTTLLRLLLGLISPDSGKVNRRKGLRIGYLPQKITIDPVFPISVVRMMTLTTGINRVAASSALLETGVEALIDEPVHTLSGGEFQRMMLARALLRNPELLVLDEPVQGVDYLGETEMYGLITRLREKRGCGVLMVSHDLHVVMASTDRVVCLNRHVCCQGRPREVSRHPEYLRLFGMESGPGLAFYPHHHEHTRHLSGEGEKGAKAEET